MKLLSVSTFYRPASDTGSPVEDGTFINVQAGIFGVADGESAAYCPDHPPIKYNVVHTGGQMAVNKLCFSSIFVAPKANLISLLRHVNEMIRLKHRIIGETPGQDDVGGASFAACQIKPNEITFIMAGDCFVLYKVKKSSEAYFFTGMDAASYETERAGKQEFSDLLKQAKGDLAKAWNLYYPHYQARRIRCSNKNIGNGGYAVLNGDSALGICWTIQSVNLASSSPEFILMGTDGLLASQYFNPERKNEVIFGLTPIYLTGGLPALLALRDKSEKSLPHIQGWPEASALELKFG